MDGQATVYLMYHELERSGRPVSQTEPGYVRYVVHEDHFREQLKWLQSAGMKGLSVKDALDHHRRGTGGIVITFDDGCETDLLVAAPILRELNFNATFYITPGFMGRPGNLTEDQLRELSDQGFDIGCHSMTHPYLNELDERGLEREIAEPKKRLEQITGRTIENFSCPGGRWSPKVAAVASRAGYRSVATSRIAMNLPGDDPYQLARIVVMRGVSLSEFQDICTGRGMRQQQLRTLVQASARRLLGNALYDRVRALILERKL